MVRVEMEPSFYLLRVYPAAARRITAGPDGALWFTKTGGGTIGRISTSGEINEYSLGQCTREGFGAVDCNPIDIATGSDGALWVTQQTSSVKNDIRRVSTSGDVTIYPLPYTVTPLFITAGPDGALWFTGVAYGGSSSNINSIVGSITTSGIITEYLLHTLQPYEFAPSSITAGPDGNLWVVDGGAPGIPGNIDRITTSGAITAYPLPLTGVPLRITAGPDGALWFTADNSYNNTPGNIGRITTSGNIELYPLLNPNYNPGDITPGPDGALWFTEIDGNRIGRITTPMLAAPTGLAAISPAQAPNLTWDTVSGAASYNIYRDGLKIGSSPANSYTDMAAATGNHSYYITAVNAAGESGPSNSITVMVGTVPTFTSTPSP